MRIEPSSVRPGEPAPAPIGKSAQSLPALLAERLVQDIVEGRLAPGSRLVETVLAQEHMVSRATVREALAQLERRHFVKRIPRLGAQVVDLSFDELTELFEIRAMLFALACARAAQQGSDADFAQAKSLADNLVALGADAGVAAEDFSHVALALQSLFLQISGSKWLQALYEQISNQTLWQVMVRQHAGAYSTPQRRRASAKDWRSVVQAVVSRDREASERAARALIAGTGDFVLGRTKGAGRPGSGK